MTRPPLTTKETITELVRLLPPSRYPLSTLLRSPFITNEPPTEYRSAIFTTTDEQARVAREVTDQVQKDHFDSNGKKIVTEITPAPKWFEAEDYHQEYLIKNPSGYQLVSLPSTSSAVR
jgi:hypothetical protein